MDAGTWASIGIGLCMVVLNTANMAYTAFVANRIKRIDNLEGELKRATESVIEQKLGLTNHRVSTIEQRLLAGDQHLKKLDDRDHDLRVEVLKAISELKDVVATKDDLQRLRDEINK